MWKCKKQRTRDGPANVFGSFEARRKVRLMFLKAKRQHER